MRWCGIDPEKLEEKFAEGQEAPFDFNGRPQETASGETLIFARASPHGELLGRRLRARSHEYGWSALRP